MTDENTVQLIPAGCKTPEGNARVAAAMERQEKGMGAAARALHSFFKTLSPSEARELMLKAGWDEEHVDDLLDEVCYALNEWTNANEEFVRALCGHPEWKDVEWFTVR